MPVRWLGKLPGDELHGLVGYQLRWIDGPDEFVMDSRMHEFDDQAVLTQMSFVVHRGARPCNMLVSRPRLHEAPRAR